MDHAQAVVGVERKAPRPSTLEGAPSSFGSTAVRGPVARSVSAMPMGFALGRVKGRLRRPLRGSALARRRLLDGRCLEPGLR
jgi:hypothetical protein